MRDSFSFEYTPCLADAAAGVRLFAWGSPTRVARSLFLTFVLPALTLVVFLPSAVPQLKFAQIAMLAVAGAGVWGLLFGLAFRAWIARYILKRQQSLGSPQRIIVSASGVEHQAGSSKHHLSWSGVSSIRELDRLFLLLAAQSPVGSIEKSAVPSESELAELRSFLSTIKPLASSCHSRSSVT